MTTNSRKHYGGIFLIFLTVSFVCLAAAMKEPSHSICYLARTGDLASLKMRVARDPALVQETTSSGGTPLHCAARGGQAEVIDYLVAQGAKVEARDEHDRTPLHWAADDGEAMAVKRLIAHGADVNARDDDGNTPLHRAAHVRRWVGEPIPLEREAQRFNTVKLLVAAGAEVNPRNDAVDDYEDETPLHLAAESNLPRVIEYLVEQETEIEARDFDGKTPLIRAADNIHGSYEALKTLVRLGADPKARTKSSLSRRPSFNALSRAAVWGHLDIVKFLLEQDVPPHYGSGSSEFSALFGAIGSASYSIGLGGKEEKQKIAERLAVIDLLANEMGGINEGVKGQFGTYDGTALELADEPYVIRHLLEKYPEEFSAENIEAKINEVTEAGEKDSRRDRKRRAKTLQLLREALEAKQGSES